MAEEWQVNGCGSGLGTSGYLQPELFHHAAELIQGNFAATIGVKCAEDMVQFPTKQVERGSQMCWS